MGQVGSQITEALTSAFGPTNLKGEVLPFNVAVLTHTEAEGFQEVQIRGRRFRPEEPYPPHLPALLSLDGERRHSAENKSDREPDQPQGTSV